VLYGRRIVIEPIERTLSVIGTVRLVPGPLDVKILALGDRPSHYLPHELDPDPGELFEVAADFENSIPHALNSDRLFARLVATLAWRDGLRPFLRDVVIEPLEHAAWLAGDRDLLTGQPAGVTDADGRFPGTTFNGRVQQRLDRFSRLRQAHGGEGKGTEVRHT